jgi:hypothetical protein
VRSRRRRVEPRTGGGPASTGGAPARAWSAATWSGLELRFIGPALTSGRISDIVVDPAKTSRWFVAAASGGVWKTENAGVSWTPVFDRDLLASQALARSSLPAADPVALHAFQQNRQADEIAADAFGPAFERLSDARRGRSAPARGCARDTQTPWTPGRLPRWEKE